MVGKAWHKWMAWSRVRLWRGWTFVRRAWRPFLVSVVFLLLGLATFTTQHRDVGTVLVAVSAIVFAKSVVDVVRPFNDDRKRISLTRDWLRVNGPLFRQYEQPYDSWHVIAMGNEHAVHHPALDAELLHARIELKLEENHWLPSGEHEDLRVLKVSTLDHDDDKVRLRSDLLPGVTELDVQRTRYSAFLVTNRLATYTYRRHGSRRDYLSFDDIATRNGLLPKFPWSKCSNHVGADVLAIADGRILLQRQAENNRLNGGKIVGSGSGSADWRDLAVSGAELGEFVRYTMRREMSEELGLRKADMPRLDDIKIIGYARLTSLAGKPQFYGIARLGPVMERIHGIETLYVDEHWDQEFDPEDGVEGLRAALDQIEYEFCNELAFPLYVNIQMLRQWLDTDPTAETWLRAGNSRLR